MLHRNYYLHPELHDALTFHAGIKKVTYSSLCMHPIAPAVFLNAENQGKQYGYFIYSEWELSTNKINDLIKQSSANAVFIGQVLTQINPNRIKAIVEKILNESNAVAAVRFKQTENGTNTGAFHVIFNNDASAARFLAFNGKVLFDRYSFLIARTPHAAQLMTQYASWWENMPDGERLKRQHYGVPRRALVAERPRSHSAVNSAGLFPPPYRSAALTRVDTDSSQRAHGFGSNN